MNKKLILSLGMVAFAMLTLASCKAKHDHTFGDSFQHDSNQHWHVCEKDGCNEVSGKENHHGGTATCTELAKCEDCGVSYGSKLSHSFTESKVDEKYLVSAADCDSSAVYYKSCVCGEKGTETFTSGEALGHAYATTYETDATHHWNVCTREGCTIPEVPEFLCTVQCGRIPEDMVMDVFAVNMGTDNKCVSAFQEPFGKFIPETERTTCRNDRIIKGDATA